MKVFLRSSISITGVGDLRNINKFKIIFNRFKSNKLREINAKGKNRRNYYWSYFNIFSGDLFDFSDITRFERRDDPSSTGVYLFLREIKLSIQIDVL